VDLALYAESLGTEMGFYKDPYQRMGTLDDEMLLGALHVVSRLSDIGDILSGLEVVYDGVKARVAAAAAGVLGLLLLANVDVLLARHFLPAEASGLYAAGAVLTKIAFWAPQFVVTLVFPRLVTAADRRRLLGRSAAVVAAVGAPLVVAAALAPRLAARLSFGEAYLDVGPTLPLFAALGTGLALVQLVLFTGMATADRGMYRLLLAAVAAEAVLVAVFLHDSVAQIVGASLAVVAALLVAGFTLALRRTAGSPPR
jgi:O-antigen/teichoic acid export membrane protein